MTEFERLRRIAEIHGAIGSGDNEGHCSECFRPYPCVTLQTATGLSAGEVWDRRRDIESGARPGWL